MFTKANEYIDKLIEEKKLPLLSVEVYKNHEKVYKRFGSYENTHTEGELLCMFSCTKVLTAVCGMRLIEEGKIEDANFHSLRHTFATRCIEAGFDIKTLSEILGHSSVKITLDKYVHSSLQLKRNNMEKLKPAAV